MPSQLANEAYIVGAVRTPVGRGHPEKGIYRDVHPAELLAHAYSGVIERTGIDADAVDNVFAGCAHQVGEQASGIARTAWLQHDLPERTGATTVDIRCGSGQQALHFAALRVQAGFDQVSIAGGVEHMGRVGFRVNEGTQEQYGRAFAGQLLEHYDLVPQGVGAEMIADKWEVTRAEMDELAVRSHHLAQQATENGLFEREILPFQVNGDVHSVDQGIRPDTSLEGLSALKPAFRENGRVTAGNSSQISAGAAAVMLASGEASERLGLTPRARVVDQVVLGVDPVTMLTGPIPATEQILKRNGMTMADIDAVEVNEAFAPVVIAWAREHKPDMAKVNQRGGAIALGHPLGATGARLIVSVLHTLEDSDAEMGLVTMCCGGGLGTATLIQRV